MSDHYSEFRDMPTPPPEDSNTLVRRLVVERNVYFNLLLNFMTKEQIESHLAKYNKF